MTMYVPAVAEIVKRDPRYAYEAYEFVFDALKHTQKKLGRLQREEASGQPGPQHHVNGRELLDGVRELALREFGLMARTVFRIWGIEKTDDFGEIVFNLVEAKLMSKTDRDTRTDFHAAYDLDQALVEEYQIRLEEQE
jgi:uncharacterized repeat protein (TIGR04138 family)